MVLRDASRAPGYPPGYWTSRLDIPPDISNVRWRIDAALRGHSGAAWGRSAFVPTPPRPSVDVAGGTVPEIPCQGFTGGRSALDGGVLPVAERARGLAGRPAGIAGLCRHDRRWRAQNISVVAFVRGGNLALHLALPRHVRPVTEHGHAAARPHADEDVCLVVDALVATAAHGEVSSGSALNGTPHSLVFEGPTNN